MIASRATGHAWAKDGTLLRVDYERGIGWVGTHYDLNLRVIQQVRGPDEEVHRVAARWAQGSKELVRGDQARPALTPPPGKPSELRWSDYLSSQLGSAAWRRRTTEKSSSRLLVRALRRQP
jgi:hypothetical protein